MLSHIKLANLNNYHHNKHQTKRIFWGCWRWKIHSQSSQRHIGDRRFLKEDVSAHTIVKKQKDFLVKCKVLIHHLIFPTSNKELFTEHGAWVPATAASLKPTIDEIILKDVKADPLDHLIDANELFDPNGEIQKRKQTRTKTPLTKFEKEVTNDDSYTIRWTCLVAAYIHQNTW
ncbi:Hypothetical protein CINCED_3A019097 [Cinara cedri]|uniref:Uncharacterized protein n=1 Tax=Cinara cedri TaxID=506608 RepID=A0A5E4ND47_9HEMI|nr:Hypothetical protein CINCED_3A019097 [Cinara cedri]